MTLPTGDPQQGSPGDSSGFGGLTAMVPQADPAADRGPDSHSMPTLSDSLKPQDDWKTRYQGLDKWVNKEFNELRGGVTELRGSVTELAQIVRSMATPQAPAPEKDAPAPVSSGKKQAGSEAPTVSALDLALEARKATQYRDTLIEEYTRTGGPAAQMKDALALFRDRIPVVTPVMGPDGKSFDDSGQRQAIEQAIKDIQDIQGSIRKDTEQAMLTGHTPGSAPGVGPGGQTAQDIYDEFQDLLEAQAAPEFVDLSQAEQDRVEARYLELCNHPVVQEKHQGQTKPTMSYQELAETVRDLAKQMARMKGPFGGVSR